MTNAQITSDSEPTGLLVASAEQNGKAAIKAQELSTKYGSDVNFFKGGLDATMEINMISQIVRRTAVDNSTPYTIVTLESMDETIRLLWNYGQNKNQIITVTALYLNWTGGKEEWKPEPLTKQTEA